MINLQPHKIQVFIIEMIPEIMKKKLVILDEAFVGTASD